MVALFCLRLIKTSPSSKEALALAVVQLNTFMNGGPQFSLVYHEFFDNFKLIGNQATYEREETEKRLTPLEERVELFVLRVQEIEQAAGDLGLTDILGEGGNVKEALAAGKVNVEAVTGVLAEAKGDAGTPSAEMGTL